MCEEGRSQSLYQSGRSKNDVISTQVTCLIHSCLFAPELGMVCGKIWNIACLWNRVGSKRLVIMVENVVNVVMSNFCRAGVFTRFLLRGSDAWDLHKEVTNLFY